MANTTKLLLETNELIEALGMLQHTMNNDLQYIDITTDTETEAAVRRLYGVAASLGMLQDKASAIHAALDKQ